MRIELTARSLQGNIASLGTCEPKINKEHEILNFEGDTHQNIQSCATSVRASHTVNQSLLHGFSLCLCSSLFEAHKTYDKHLYPVVMYCSLWPASYSLYRFGSVLHWLSPIARLRLSIRFEQLAGKVVYNISVLDWVETGMFLSNSIDANTLHRPVSDAGISFHRIVTEAGLEPATAFADQFRKLGRSSTTLYSAIYFSTQMSSRGVDFPPCYVPPTGTAPVSPAAAVVLLHI